MIYVNSINITNSGNLSIRETRVNGPFFEPITPTEKLAAGNESDDGGQEEEQPLSATVPVQNSESNQVQCSSMVVNAVDSAMESTSSSTVPQFNQYCWRYRNEANNESNEPSSVQSIADSESSNTSSEECNDAEEDEVPKTPDPYTNDCAMVLLVAFNVYNICAHGYASKPVLKNVFQQWQVT
ncbi:unnamed protein product [Orchesella dallaii]|uniref:Uncharacterized protein n=1 Tax=Orchesella dallaii TaxID=48710 RepID=A0ABP1Q135_9HEXA